MHASNNDKNPSDEHILDAAKTTHSPSFIPLTSPSIRAAIVLRCFPPYGHQSFAAYCTRSPPQPCGPPSATPPPSPETT